MKMQEEKITQYEYDIRCLISGIFISIGAYANIILGGIIGAIFFSFGLLSIIKFRTPLFTGMVCNLKNYTDKNVSLCNVLLLNLFAAAICGILANLNGIESQIDIALKLDKGFYNVLIDAIICGICVGGAVTGRNSLLTILAVSLFVACGGDHCIANMFYFSFIGFPGASIFVLFISILGNMIGGSIVGYLDNK